MTAAGIDTQFPIQQKPHATFSQRKSKAIKQKERDFFFNTLESTDAIIFNGQH
jgi:hypothetical protein